MPSATRRKQAVASSSVSSPASVTTKADRRVTKILLSWWPLCLGACAVLASMVYWYFGSVRVEGHRERLSSDVLLLLRCGEKCAEGYTEMDWQFAERAASARKEPVNIHLAKACLWRCQRSASQEAPLEMDEFAPPKGFWAYKEAAQECAAMVSPAVALQPGEAAAETLKRCGAVHLQALLPRKLMTQLATAWKDLQLATRELEQRTDTSRLRAGRHEVWVPFKAPFNDTDLIAGGPLRQLLSAYWPGNSAVLDHISIINAIPGSKAQPLHSDVLAPNSHLEFHTPLVDITTDLGPTRFCPGTQRMATENASAEGGWRFVAPAKLCEAEPSLGYSFAPASPGTVTVYDAAVVHGGGAVASTRERPVLQLSFASSAATLRQRAYLEQGFRDAETAEDSRALAMAEALRFRKAFTNLQR